MKNLFNLVIACIANWVAYPALMIAGDAPPLMWEARFPQPEIMNDIKNMAIATDGSILTVGSWGAGDYTAVVAVSPADGSIRWSTLIGADTTRIGVSLADVPGKGIVLTGFASATDARGPFIYRPFDANLTSEGKKITYSSWPATRYSVYFFTDDKCIARTNDGGYVILSELPYQGPYIINFRRFNAAGEFQYEKLYDTMRNAANQNTYLSVRSLIITNDGGFAALYEVGRSQPDSIYLAKFSADGDRLWRRNLQNTPINYKLGGLVENADSSLAVVTNSYAGPSPNISKTVLRHFSAEGNLLRTNYYSALGITIISSIARMSDGGLILAGYTGNHPPEAISIRNDSLDNVVIRTDAEGKEVWKKIWGVEGIRDELTSVAVAPDGAIYVGGIVRSTPKGGYMAKIVEGSVAVTEQISPTVLTITPNPAAEIFTVSCPTGATVTVRDVFGRVMSIEPQIVGEEATFSTADYPSGVYFVGILTASGRRVTEKVVVSR